MTQKEKVERKALDLAKVCEPNFPFSYSFPTFERFSVTRKGWLRLARRWLRMEKEMKRQGMREKAET